MSNDFQVSGADPSPPRVFISYSHESAEHADSVRRFADRLRSEGIDCILDQYVVSPAEGWPLWMDKQIRDADFVLMVCTETYHRRVMNEEQPGIGLGVRWEGRITYQLLYNQKGVNLKFIPVMFESGKVEHIPTPLQGFPNYRIDTQEGYEDLYRRLTDQPRYIQPELGKRRSLPPLEAKQNFFAMPLMNLPFERNAFFTGRDEVLETLRTALGDWSAAQSTQAQVISGMGGMGKTQIALEYAYRYREDYQAIFWVRADSRIGLSAGFIQVARLLGLPEKDAQNPDDTVNAVIRWLESNSGWLLIFDNADVPDLLKAFRPHHSSGHILLTSRAQVFDVLGIARPVELGTMTPAEALEFLFTRTGRQDDQSQEKTSAAELAGELGYLPLALEQAAAFITAKHARFQDYLSSYGKRRLQLLNQSAPVAGDYPQSVATTWEINFTEVEKASKAASDLLRASAFLSPDSIPFELIAEGKEQLGPTLTEALVGVEEDWLILNQVLETLTRYSLIRLDSNKQTYSIHRVVQEVVKDRMDEESRRLWAERMARALNRTFPDVEFKVWPRCERLLAHARVAARHIKKWEMTAEESGQLLYKVASYCYFRGQYPEAEPLLKQALIIMEKALGPDHPYIARCLSDLATLYYSQGRYAEAELLYNKALEIRKKVLGPDHHDVAASLNNLAMLYHNQGRYAEAEPLYSQALIIMEKAVGADHHDVAANLNNLAMLYYNQGKYDEAEPLHKQALEIRKKALGPDHPDVAMSLNNLALLYYTQGRYAETYPLFEQALAIYEKVLGPDHPTVATNLNNMATLYYSQGRYAEAELLHNRALEIREKALGPDHHDVAASLNNLAMLYYSQGRYAEAELLHNRALEIREKALGPDHHDVADSLNNLAMLYYNQGKYDEAEPLYKRALEIKKKALGLDHHDVAMSLNNLALLYDIQGRYAEAEPLHNRALEIREKALGPDHPDVAASLNNLAMLYHNQGRYAEAEPLYKQSLEIFKKALGPDHPNVATNLNNLAMLYYNQGKYDEAEPLHKQALEIRRKALGPDHPGVAMSLNNLALLYDIQGKYSEAEPLYRQALETLEKAFGPHHPNVITALENYSNLLRNMQRNDEAAAMKARTKEIREALPPTT